VSWVDAVIVVTVLWSAYRGSASGALRQTGALLGFFTGFIVATFVAAGWAQRLDPGPGRAGVAMLLLIAGAVAGAIVGRVIGSSAASSLRRLRAGTLDSTLGAALAVAGSLVACWIVAATLAPLGFGGVSDAIARSKILIALDTVMPPVPSVEARVQALVNSADFPAVFSSAVPPVLTAPSPVGSTGSSLDPTLSVRTVKVVAKDRCGVQRQGTAFYVSQGHYMTAAHVVAGATDVALADGVGRVIYFDPRNDVAVVAGPAMNVTAPRFASGSAGTRDTGGRDGISRTTVTSTRPWANWRKCSRRLAVTSTTACW
jgi:uncharacterized membrane protein required for colicin V production